MNVPFPVSRVEKKALENTGQPLQFPPGEKIGVVVVHHFPALGKLAAMRFIEWVQENPGGVVSLPTGKTPEYFIKFVTRVLGTWDRKDTRKDLESSGIDPSVRPDMKSLHFVQIDEFYPMDPGQHNSFTHFVNRFYLKGFGFDSKKAALIDCSKIGLPRGQKLEDVWPGGNVDLSLRYRHPSSNLESVQKDVLQAVDQWCYAYEERIAALGGIGFFLGGIGPDGHIAFNISGSDHHTTTRLTPTNYETQAAAATDLGGIEVARKRHAITIGLATITRNPACTAIIIAAGEAKAGVVRDAVCGDVHIRFPATALRALPRARFYLTSGAAKNLTERQLDAMKACGPSPRLNEKVVVDLALRLGRRILDLKQGDFQNDVFGSFLLKRPGEKCDGVAQKVHEALVGKLNAGAHTRNNTVFLHTAPHHDDIMLGYFPFVVRHIRDASNRHHFVYMTSGFTAVTNAYALAKIKNLQYFIARQEFRALLKGDYFRPSNINGRNRDVWQYLDGVAADNAHMKSEGEARRLLRNLMEIFDEENADALRPRIDELESYFATQYAGKRDLAYIQRLKGMLREWEADCLWGYLGFDSSSVRHMRLGFYQGDIFTEEPTLERDVAPVAALLSEIKPDVVTVAMDPEASGPDTHYKVMQVVSEALKQYESQSGRKDITVIGYRNVWYRFHPSEAQLFVPVSLNMFATLQSAFRNAFVSQKNASFPSYEYDGPFSGLAQKVQVEQYQMLKTCLGRRFFNEHERPLIRATRGFVFLKSLSLQEFYAEARELRETTESL